MAEMVVKQECTACGRQFDLRYLENGTYEYCDECCECEADFHPVNGPTLSEWLKRKER